MTLKIKRIYNEAADSDGYRILIDRLWPRGITKTEAKLDEWIKSIAPSDALRQWYGHEPERFAEFKDRYIQELDANPATTQLKETIAKHKNVTLLFAAKTADVSNAAVLQAYLKR